MLWTNWLDQVRSRAVGVATCVNVEGGREVLGTDIGDSEDETSRSRFLRSLKTGAGALGAPVVYQARPKASPAEGEPGVQHRVRTDRIDNTGKVTLRHNGRLHHIGIGRTHARTHVILLLADLDIRVINAATGELLRALTLDPTKDYQPTGKPRSQKRRNPRT